jgi:hypothetical protein
MQPIRQAELHILDVTKERSVYQGALEKAKLSVVPYFSKDGTFSPPLPASKRPPNKTPISAHYSFDMAQQVFYPNDPLQPGPMYFLTPRKCAIFGVCCEAIPRQINYLIDEAVDMGKGSNAIVSMLHHFFTHHGLGEEIVHLHADNCGGQNKNAIMVQYLLWRVMTGQHKQITLSFMIPGHTKFSPDWCFGLLKKRYRRTKVGGLTDLIGVVNESATVNVAQPTGLEDGSVVVTTYDWQEYFKTFCTKVTGIKKLHHIRFDSAHPGFIFTKEKTGSTEVKRSILKVASWSPQADQLPPVLHPAGLSSKRQWYLYDKIREFCPENVQDITCPRPSAPPERLSPSRSPSPIPPPSSSTPRTTAATATATASTAITDTDEPPTKKARLCGACRQPGHNARTCPNK